MSTYMNKQYMKGRYKNGASFAWVQQFSHVGFTFQGWDKTVFEQSQQRQIGTSFKYSNKRILRLSHDLEVTNGPKPTDQTDIFIVSLE